MMQTICGMSRRSAAIGAILTHGMATNSLRLICMTKVLQCDAQARGGGGRRVADDTGHRARLERRDRMGHNVAVSGRRRLSSQSSACALIPTDDDCQPDGEQSFTSASAAGLSLRGYPGSMFVT